MISRFEQARQVVDGVVDVFLVEIRNLGGHFVEGAGFLTDGDHLDDHVREQVGIFHRLLQALTRRDLVAHLQERLCS